MTMMNDSSNVGLTARRWDDDDLRWRLNQRLWGYPELVSLAFNSRLAEVRIRNIEQSETRHRENDEASLSGPNAVLNRVEVHDVSGKGTTRDPSQISSAVREHVSI